MGRQCRDESVGSGHPEPARLTGGEHMMVYLRTLAGNATSSPGLEVGAHVRPKITVCDELCGGLDPRMRQRVKRIKNGVSKCGWNERSWGTCACIAN